LLHLPSGIAGCPAAAFERRQVAAPDTSTRVVAAKHPRKGRIIETITRVLSDHGEPMHARAIREAVETVLGEPVRSSTIKATLAGNRNGPSPRFVRIAPGVYGAPGHRTR
jgi:hypothetical protein